MPEKSYSTASTFIQHDHTSPEILSEYLPSSSTAIIPDMAVDDVDQEASTGRVPHGYGNTRGVSKMGNMGSGTVSDFGIPRILCTHTAVLRVFHG